MGKAEKLYQKWSAHIPREAHLHEVTTFLDTYFPGMWKQKSSSHIVVRCSRLAMLADYRPFGEISIPVKGGQRVKGFYIKEIIRAKRALEELGVEDHEKEC
ncbi:hypothetical protein [Desulfatiglans anilini]|uniref:hypothetical protein n=1 Tax=Desulfatiglans anilini TaxID=90728 RepID=UPI0003F7B37C|nr:hypothetical protein [Desulfatiglans anilini]